MTTRIFGSGIRRREDPRLITGQATYTDDVQLPGMVHAAILRSPHAHARIRSVDTAAAGTAPGVIAVYTGADTDGVLNPIPCAWLIPDSDIKAVPYLAIAKDVVRYGGEAVAVVVAENRYQAEDALELINVDYEPLPVVIKPRKRPCKRERPNFTTTLPATRLSTGWRLAATPMRPSSLRRLWSGRPSSSKG